MRIRELVSDDWPLVWPIVEDVITAQETFPFSPDWSSEAARDVWVERPPGLSIVAVEDVTESDRANVLQWSCHSGNNQRWILNQMSDGFPAIA